jgi:uncharacterized protein (UPF0333 family)
MLLSFIIVVIIINIIYYSIENFTNNNKIFMYKYKNLTNTSFDTISKNELKSISDLSTVCDNNDYYEINNSKYNNADGEHYPFLCNSSKITSYCNKAKNNGKSYPLFYLPGYLDKFTCNNTMNISLNGNTECPSGWTKCKTNCIPVGIQC